MTTVTPESTAILGLSLLLLAVAAVDCRGRRIPNRWVGVGALHALACQALLPVGTHPASALHAGTPGVLSGLAAALLMLAAAGTLWRLGLWGAGDAKWLTVTAAHAGPALVPLQLLLTAVAGGLLALGWMAARRRDRMPYAVAIAAGEFGLMGLVAFTGLMGPWALENT